jgi:hypothetical protein
MGVSLADAWIAAAVAVAESGAVGAVVLERWVRGEWEGEATTRAPGTEDERAVPLLNQCAFPLGVPLRL